MPDRITEHRRQLHRIPELDFDLPKTRAYVQTVLSALPCEIIAAGRTGLCAYFDAGKPDTTAFRSDMDALPIAEESDRDYASTHPGRMHACGHDGHMAILLGFAEELSRRAGTLPHNVLLLFQAAEETMGGAQEICDAGVFEKYKVSKIFGLHLWPGYEKGAVVCRKGAFMAKACVFRIDLFGKSIHAAAAKKGVDALLAGAHFITEAYKPERGILPDNDTVGLFKFCMFESGTATNIVSGHSVLQGTIRCFEEDVFCRMTEGLRAVATDVERRFGCRVEIEFVLGCPAVYNDPGLFDRFKDALCGRATARLPDGDDGAPFLFTEPPAPTMTSEDFSVYLQKTPGIFFHLGLGRNAPLHSCGFDFDESVLPVGVKAFLRLLYAV
ncbi:MAG: amidohydrolase [Clostridiales Family XIII bacterium]|jgi:hippurate hydrolase|nr:amidohydrolase [Clostridiales Family XIII bacterium]